MSVGFNVKKGLCRISKTIIIHFSWHILYSVSSVTWCLLMFNLLNCSFRHSSVSLKLIHDARIYFQNAMFYTEKPGYVKGFLEQDTILPTIELGSPHSNT